MSNWKSTSAQNGTSYQNPKLKVQELITDEQPSDDDFQEPDDLDDNYRQRF